MPSDQLENLVKVRQLKPEPPSEKDISGLIRSGLARLRDSRNKSLSIESRFDLAYNAAHALSLAALRKAGYRSESRYIVFQCLKHTLDFPNENWRVLDNAHRLRNIAEYEGELDVNEALLESLIRTVTKLSDLVSAFDNSRA